MNNYKDFLEQKSSITNRFGFKPLFIPDYLYDFQKYLLEWSVTTGKCATFADCGLGKTPLQLVWAQNIVMKTNSNVLILGPKSVVNQTVREAEKFGIEVEKSTDGKFKKKIVVTNYERLHYFDSYKFENGGVVCDESSILKNFKGAIKSNITEFSKKIKYASLYTATASPNDYIELGTHSEMIGNLGYIDMLGEFFKNNENSLHPIWWGSKYV